MKAFFGRGRYEVARDLFELRVGRCERVGTGGIAIVQTLLADRIGHVQVMQLVRDTGALEEALASFRRAVDLQPEYEDAARGLGEVLMDAGKHREGLEALANASGVIRFDVGAGVTVGHGELF